MRPARSTKNDGILLHAKHAYMPNHLGYCGPDDRGRILQAIEESTGGERLVSTLREFEAAYPFLELISKASGRQVFDYPVPEAYWIGNSLLDKVPAGEFYQFSHGTLKGRDRREVHRLFKTLQGSARPHHSFYVMSTYASAVLTDGPSLPVDGVRKFEGLVNDCRISWGRVKAVGKKRLDVESMPVRIVNGRLVLDRPKMRRVGYNPEVRSFANLKAGDFVSLHWDYACEVLTRRQQSNIERYTNLDLVAINRILASRVERR